MFWALRFYLNQINKNGSFSHLKYYSRWKKSFEENASSVKDEQPWITFEAIDYLKNNIHLDSKVFEYGGGGSTLFFVKRSKEVVTVEHNKEWFSILSNIMKKKEYKNWKGDFIEAQTGNYIENPDKANPDHYSSDDEDSKHQHYYNYASAIDRFTDNYFDVILIDGRSRSSCIKHALPKLKSGGLLVLDNSDREYYTTFFKEKLSSNFSKIIENVGPSPYSREFTKTTIWKKNK